MGRKRLHAPEISATLRLRYSPICSSVSLVVNGAGTSAISEAMVVVRGCTEGGVGGVRREGAEEGLPRDQVRPPHLFEFLAADALRIPSIILGAQWI